MKTIINNQFVMSCNSNILVALALCAGMTSAAIKHHNKKQTLRAAVGTMFANSATLGAAFNDGSLDSTMLASAALDAAIDGAAYADMRQQAENENAQRDNAAQAQASAQASAQAQASASARKQIKSAKAWLIELFSAVDAAGKPVAYTLHDLVALTGKSEINVRTMLSDLRSAKYAGKYGVFKTVSTRVDNVLKYSKTS